MEVIEKEIQLAQQNRLEFTILFLDLDRFKIINDTLRSNFTGEEGTDKKIEDFIKEETEAGKCIYDIMHRIINSLISHDIDLCQYSKQLFIEDRFDASIISMQSRGMCPTMIVDIIIKDESLGLTKEGLFKRIDRSHCFSS